MDQLQYSHTKIPQMKNKKRLTEEQVRILEISFSFKNKLDLETKTHLARQLGIPTRQVAIWYQNRRAREKTQSLEADHNALQLRIENVLQDNAKLREESEWLKAELIRVQNMSKSSSSCESELIKKQTLEREFYDCLVGGVGQFVTSDEYKFSAS